VTHARLKTGIDRRCPLWPETVEALRKALEVRPKPKGKENAGLVFVTRLGLAWGRTDLSWEKAHDGSQTLKKVKADNPISREIAKLLRKLGIQRRGVNFYALRHVFETIGGEARDQVAVDHIMGHADTSMAGAYRERISDDRLRAVTDHVRAWLFGSKETK
jgi:integrase